MTTRILQSRAPGFARYKQAQTFFAVPFTVLSWLFLWASLIGVDTMAPDTYGSAAVKLDAEIWALWQNIAGLTMLIGIAINGRNRRLSSFMRAWGAFGLFLELTALGVSAVFYGGQFLVGAFSLIYAFKAGFFTIISLIDMAISWRPGSNG